MLLQKISQNNIEEYVDTRKKINSIQYIVSLLIFWFIAYKYSLHSRSLQETIFLFVFLVPCYSSLLVTINKIFIYKYNLLYLIFSLISIIITSAITYDVVTNNYHVDNQYIIFGIICALPLIMVTSPIILSFPFKLIHYFVFNSGKLYYDITVHDALKLEPKESTLKKDELILESKNETQLSVMLQNAISEEDYELASKIREILNKKFE